MIAVAPLLTLDTAGNVRNAAAAIGKTLREKQNEAAQVYDLETVVTGMQKKRRGFKVESKAQAQEIICLKHDNAVYLEALRDLMAFFDKVQGKCPKGSSGNWVVAEVKRIEAIRFLVIDGQRLP